MGRVKRNKSTRNFTLALSERTEAQLTTLAERLDHDSTSETIRHAVSFLELATREGMTVVDVDGRKVVVLP